MNGGQAGVVCPMCGSAAAVHSIQELADMARMALAEQGYPAQPQQGWAGQPQPGAPQQPGWAAQPQAGPVPGYAGQPRSGPLPGNRPGGGPTLSSGYTRDPLDQLGEDVAGMAMGAVAGFLGRAISRRVQNATGQGLSDLVAKNVARKQEQLRTAMVIAERHPDLCACWNDQVIFVAGGRRTLPVPDLNTITAEQADALAAQLRG
ncbi:MAG: hypothetical protein ACM32E_18685 [Gemmatimonadota bacterium]